VLPVETLIRAIPQKHAIESAVYVLNVHLAAISVLLFVVGRTQYAQGIEAVKHGEEFNITLNNMEFPPAVFPDMETDGMHV
jgi:hypothetical protein